MSFDISLTGKVAIVTGASSGIGAGIAEMLAAAGATVALVGRNEAKLADVRDRIAGGDGQASVIVADLDDADSPKRIVEGTLDQYDRLDSLVNCAGIFLVAPADESLELLERQWNTNVRAPFALTLAALPELRRRRGTVLFLSSIAGKVGFPSSSAYCATKGAIELMTRALAVEEAPNGVRVNAIAPGNVETPMNEHLMDNPAYKRQMIDATPLGRNGVVGDIAPLAVFLAAGESAYMTGESILVDGGWTAQ